MNIYLMVMGACMLLGIVMQPRRQIKKKNYLLASFLLIIIVSSLRHYSVGKDLYGHYYNSFTSLQNLSWKLIGSTSYETGYVAFNKVIGTFTNNPQWMIAIHSLLVMGISGWFIYKESDDPALSTYMFITTNTWFMYLTMFRQSLAICIILIAWEVWGIQSWKWRRYILFWGLVFLATSFHSSAIMFVLLPLVDQLKFKKKHILYSVFAMIFVMVFYNRVFQLASSIIGVRRDYADFYSNSGAAINLISIYGVAINLLIFIIAYISLVYYRGKERVEQKFGNECGRIGSSRIDTILYMVLFYLLCKICGLRVNIMGRMAYYFGPFTWILVPKSIAGFSSVQNKRIVRYGLYIIMGLAFCAIAYRAANTLYGVVPYRFYWE